MKLRSIELVLPDAAKATEFLCDIWGLLPAGGQQDSHYVRGCGSDPYLVALHEGAEPFVRSTTFTCSAERIDRITAAASIANLAVTATISNDPGGGKGIIVELPEGQLLRFLTGAAEVEPVTGLDMPVRLTHVVFNSADAEAVASNAEQILGFTVSDRTKAMVFVRCNTNHHSTAFARAGHSSLNHIAFEMADTDAVMRGIGRMRDHGYAPAWGPGRHGPGDNVFGYFIAPFGAVIEYSTPVEVVADDYRTGAPEDWTWPPNRIDQWGLSDKDTETLGIAERNFRFRREWQPATAGV